MNLIGDVARRPACAEIGRGLEVQLHVGRQHVVDSVALEREQPLGHQIDRDGREHPLVPDASSRVLVDVVDQLTNGGCAVAHDMRGFTKRCRHQIAVDDEHPEIESGQTSFHNDAVTDPARRSESGFELRGIRDAGRDAPAVVTNLRLHRDGVAHVFRHAACVGKTPGGRPLRGRDACTPEKLLGPGFLIGYLDTERAGSIGHRGLNTALLGAIPELDKTDLVETQGRDPSSLRFLDDAMGGRSEQIVLAQLLELGDDRADIKRAIPCGGFDQGNRFPTCEEPGRFHPVAVHDLVDARSGRVVGLAKPDLHRGQALELQRHVLDDVTGPRASLQALDEAAGLANRASVTV